MNRGLIAIVITTYNCPKHIIGMLRSIHYQAYSHYAVIIADDGSTDETVNVIKAYKDIHDMHLLELEHGERGVARYKAVERAILMEPEYLLILDSDMILKRNLLEEASKAIEIKSADGLVIKEIPYSKHRNLFSKVKVFERTVLNNSKCIHPEHSIEAARFWKTDAFVKTGGISIEQIAFEEIQPTIRCLDNGGTVKKLMTSGVYHDEKEVTLSNIIMKKNYYFSKLGITMDGESQGVMKALKRWYLFRPVYYTKENLWLYVRHPILTLAMILMYMVLTLNAAYHVCRYYLDKTATA